MNRVLDSPIPKMDLESEISQQLDKIAETGNKFREQILELGEKLKFIHEAEGQKNQELQDQSDGISEDWIKSVEIKLKKVTDVQHKISVDVRELEERRLNLQELMAGKLEDVLKDVKTLKSWTKATMELKPKLNEGSGTVKDLESQIEKMKGELKEKLDLLEAAAKSNHDAVKSSLKTFGIPTPEELTDSDGWIVIQRRDSGPRDDFERGWFEYENGFGSVDGNLWLGLKKIHELTADGSMELRVELTDWDGKLGYANYSKFSVENAAYLYRLSVGGYSGTVGDSFQHSNGSQFSTMDKRTCRFEGKLRGGWWKNSSYANLNGFYYEEEEAKLKATRDYAGVFWYDWKKTYSLQKVLMKIRNRKETVPAEILSTENK